MYRALPLVLVFANALAAAPPGTRLGLGGLDPVALCQGREQKGLAAHVASQGRFHFRFADAGNRFDQLVELARTGDRQGKDLDFEIEVLDVLDRTASAGLTAKWGGDHMQLIQRDGRWQIVHVLWQSHPPRAK